MMLIDRHADRFCCVRTVLGCKIFTYLHGGGVLAEKSEPKLVANYVEPQQGVLYFSDVKSNQTKKFEN